MKAYVFPGQGAQFSGMGADLYQKSAAVKALFDRADEILGFSLSQTMFSGSDEELRQTKVTQPAVFLHSVALAKALGEGFQPEMVAGHSLGEFSALVAAGAMNFEDGLRLVSKRAMAMQKACEMNPSTMAAIIALPDNVVEEVCASIPGVVVPANMLGKIKTVSQIVCVSAAIIEPMLYEIPFLHDFLPGWWTAHVPLTYITCAAMTLFTVLSGVNYFRAMWKYLDPGK